jgi:hypothetical protein
MAYETKPAILWWGRMDTKRQVTEEWLFSAEAHCRYFDYQNIFH